jgi:hypothetical protein
MLPRLAFAAVILLAGLPFARSQQPEAKPKPKLAVLIVFDQMRGDYVDRWKELFVPDGFRRLETEGAWFTNCHYPYATTQTGPGHASLLSGCSADRHGIIANNWYERKEGAPVYCATNIRYERVPPRPADAAVKKPAGPPLERSIFDENPNTPGFGAPSRMLVQTLGDTVKSATNGEGKVFGLSLKDRSAILPAGEKPDGCYWADKGEFITSNYYRTRLHPWVTKFNQEKSSDRWFGQNWDRLNPNLNYARYSGPDEVAGEDEGAHQGRSFPHPIGAAKKLGSEYYSALANSPFGNQVLLDLACRCIEEEQLGKHSVPDLLIISFSSNDLIGHCWGPDSQEVLDVTLRSDLIIRDLLRFLDQNVGQGNYVVAMSADHGICPLPEVTRSQGRIADRIPPMPLMASIEQHLQQTYGNAADKQHESDKKAGQPARWIETANDAGIYLNQRLFESLHLDLDSVANELANWISQQPSIQTAYSRQQLSGNLPAYDEIGRRVQKSFHPERSGDVMIVFKPYDLLTSRRTGTNHGTPHPYDTHVPLLIFGPGIKAAKRTDPVTPQAIAAILAHAIGVPAPAAAEAPVPDRLFE